jgi:hypothetical protein
MKIAIVSESSANEAAIKILVDAIVGSESALFPLRTRAHGWTTVFPLLEKIIPALHYGHPDVEALVVVMDSDDTPVHRNIHDVPNNENLACRLCKLRAVVNSTLTGMQPLPNRRPLKTALGLAVPSMEAWYRAGLDSHINEIAWSRKLAGEKVPYDRRSLKKDTYGSERPGLSRETDISVAAAQRLANEIEMLEQLFPDGFGSLLRDLRTWQ